MAWENDEEKNMELHRHLLYDNNDVEYMEDKKNLYLNFTKKPLLSPWEKWIKHGRFPYKILLHLCLIALTLCQMVIYDSQNAAYMRASQLNWAYFFLPPSSDVGISPRFQRDLYRLNETLSALSYIRNAYYTISKESIANYDYTSSKHYQIRPMDMTVSIRIPLPGTSESKIQTSVYKVLPYPARLGPFDDEMTIKNQVILRSIESIELKVYLIDAMSGNLYQECFQWGIPIRIFSISRSRLQVQIETCELTRCELVDIAKLNHVVSDNSSYWRHLRHEFVWLNLLVIFVSIIYFILSAKTVWKSLHTVSRAQEILKTYMKDYETTIPPTIHMQDNKSMQKKFKRWFEKASMRLKSIEWQFLNIFQVVVIIALILLLLSAAWSLIFLKAYVPINYWHRLLHGIAILILWSSLVGYLEHNHRIYSIVLTLKWGIPRILQFLIGVSPIFVGFALFGSIYFGPDIAGFGSLSASMITLFSVMNGDVILDTFDAFDLHGFHVSGKLYLCFFIALFIYVVLNVFIAIVEEAFFATRQYRRMLDVLLNTPTSENVGKDELTRRDSYFGTTERKDQHDAELLKLLVKLLEEKQQ